MRWINRDLFWASLTLPIWYFSTARHSVNSSVGRCWLNGYGCVIEVYCTIIFHKVVFLCLFDGTLMLFWWCRYVCGIYRYAFLRHAIAPSDRACPLASGRNFSSLIWEFSGSWDSLRSLHFCSDVGISLRQRWLSGELLLRLSLTAILNCSWIWCGSCWWIKQTHFLSSEWCSLPMWTRGHSCTWAGRIWIELVRLVQRL